MERPTSDFVVARVVDRVVHSVPCRVVSRVVSSRVIGRAAGGAVGSVTAAIAPPAAIPPPTPLGQEGSPPKIPLSLRIPRLPRIQFSPERDPEPARVRANSST